MKLCFKYVVLSVILLLTQACELSKYPIDEPPSVKIDTRLLGKWKAKMDSTTYTVTKLNKFDYNILSSEKSKNGIKTENYTAFLSDINNIPFLNVFAKGDSGIEGYIFIKLMEIHPNSINVAVFNDSTLKFLNSPAEVRERISKNLNNPVYYTDTLHLFKVK